MQTQSPENPGAAEWSAARGNKWSTHLAGMEAMVAPVDGSRATKPGERFP